MLRVILFIVFLNASIVYAESDPDFAEGLVIDLRQPAFCDGVLTTETGGVIQAPGIRIQAQKVVYTRKKVDDMPVCKLQAEGDLILEFGDYFFVGESLEYDFQTREGVMYQGRTSIEPWFFGGDVIFLNPDGSFTLQKGFVTTSESVERDWEISTEIAHLQDRKFLTAKNVQFRIYDVPLLWLPTFRTNLESIYDAPLRYNFKWGGRQGARGSMVYELFVWNHFKTFLRLDYRIKRGFGGGVETYWRSEDSKELLNTINYVARDNSLSNPHENTRYRFQGIYHNLVLDDRVSVDLTWDKLSDRDMATDYNDRGLELDTAGRTQFLVRRQEDNHIERFISQLRVNQFQSVKQELPTVEVSWRPISIAETGIITHSLFRASYLDFAYGNDAPHVHDYNSTRAEWRQTIYRPVPLGFFTVTPQFGGIGIYYGNSPQRKNRFLGVADFGVEAKTSLSKRYGTCLHVIEPYGRFDYLTSPTASPSQHYIFDIDDGWFQSNTLRLGVMNQMYVKHSSGLLTRPIFVDLFTYGFFDTPTIGRTFPKAYLTVSTLTTPTLRQTFESAWDFQHGELDHFNIRADWTVATNLAIRGEYRHRSAYAWRKADYSNFILDAYRKEKVLLHSALSDRRDTLLTSLFYQLDPNWAFQFEMRHGWNRRHEPSYTEFEVDLLGTLQSAMNIKLSYQHKEDDDRVAIYFSIGIKKPNQAKCEAMLPCLEL